MSEDTVAMETVEAPRGEPKGWMETTTAGDFSWE